MHSNNRQLGCTRGWRVPMERAGVDQRLLEAPRSPSIPHGAAELRLPPEDTCCSQLLQAAATGVTAPITFQQQPAFSYLGIFLFNILNFGFISGHLWPPAVTNYKFCTRVFSKCQQGNLFYSHREMTSPSCKKGKKKPISVSFLYSFSFYFHTIALG